MRLITREAWNRAIRRLSTFHEKEADQAISKAKKFQWQNAWDHTLEKINQAINERDLVKVNQILDDELSWDNQFWGAVDKTRKQVKGGELNE